MSIPSEQFSRVPVISLQAHQSTGNVGKSAPNSPINLRQKRQMLDMPSCGEREEIPPNLVPSIDFQQSQTMTSSLTNIRINDHEDEYDTTNTLHGHESLPTQEINKEESFSSHLRYLHR